MHRLQLLYLALPKSRLFSLLLLMLISAISYGIATAGSLTLRFPNSLLTAFWAPTTILLAGLLLIKLPSWPVWIMAIIPAHLAVHTVLDVPFERQALQIGHNIGFALSSALGLRYYFSGRIRFNTRRDISIFLIIVLGSAVIWGGVIQAIFTWRGFTENFWLAWRLTSFSNILPAVTLLPTILLIVEYYRSDPPAQINGQLPEAISLASSLMISSVLIFGGRTADADVLSAMVYAPLPLLIWAAMRFGPIGTSIATTSFTLLILGYAAMGRGPFTNASPTENILHLQAYALAFGLPLLLLATLVNEYLHMQVALQELNDELEARIGKRTAELEQANHELAVARDAAEAASEAKARFLASMSHEIRTPLNAVIGMSELLRHTNLSVEQRSLVGTISNGGRALLAVINDILDLSRIESGYTPIVSEPFELHTCLTNSVDLVTYDAHSKELSIGATLDPSLPQIVLGDEDRLRQILLNLLANAVKFTEHGGVKLQAYATPDPIHPIRSHVVITVSDTGIGMTPVQLEHIFKPFTQAENNTMRRYGGTGLGLTISKHLVELMGGRIEVESTAGVGSTFTIFLLFETAPEYLLIKAAEAPPQPIEPLHILVVEDNPINQDVIQRQLVHMGHTFILLSDGQSAIDAVRASHYDVVLMDLQLPHLDGETATRRIRELGPEIEQPYIIALTASALDTDRERLLRAGVNDYLTKPVQPGMLHRALAGVPPPPGDRHASQPKPQPSPAAVTLIDWQGFEQYVAMFGGVTIETVTTVRQLFDEHLHQEIAELIMVAQAQDYARMHADAHRLHGSCLQLGLPALAQLCRQIEFLPPEADPQPFTTALNACFKQTQALLHQRFDNVYSRIA